MADEMVELAQRFINSYDVAGIPQVEVNGRTSWKVMHALTRALQYELGITELSDGFGPTTLSALRSRFGACVDGSTRHGNVYRIAQSGLYCKGYDGGGIDASYNDRVVDSVIGIKSDMGVGGAFPGGGLEPKVFKALLTMDPYVRVGDGTEAVRGIQRWLNGRYVGRREFFVCPCDGHFSRDVQKALVFALQYEIGMGDDTANGRFGPGTQDGVRSQALLEAGSADGARQFVRLFQAAMRFNGWDVAFDGRYSQALAHTVAEFQRFARLLAGARRRGLPHLGLPAGEHRRSDQAGHRVRRHHRDHRETCPGSAGGGVHDGRPVSDQRRRPERQEQEDPARRARHDHRGRTLRLPDLPDQRRRPGVLQPPPGARDALAALEAARGHGFLPGTTLYFAVDYDAVDEEVTSLVIPRFRALAARMHAYGSEYRIGVYAPRNTCSRLARAGLTTASFVSDMSTGYSGNLGFPLPGNWAFDQITTLTVGTGAGYIEIDKNIASGRDPGQNRFAPRVRHPPGRRLRPRPAERPHHGPHPLHRGQRPRQHRPLARAP